MILGRYPESEEAIKAHMGLPDVLALREVLLNSTEFRHTRKLLEFDEKWVCTEVYGGKFILWLDLHDKYVSYGCLMDNYEPVETSIIEANLRDGQVALDIGANIGWHTLGMSSLVGPAGRVIAFEPRQITRSYLRRTIRDNKLGVSVQLHDFGLWDAEMEGGLSWAEATVNPGGSYLEFDKSRAMQTINLKTLDSLDIQKVDLIKIDVEGAEYKVLRGSVELIKKHGPIILSEIYPAQLRSISGCSAKEYISFLSSFGYKCHILEPGFLGMKIEDFPSYATRELVSVVFSHDSNPASIELEISTNSP